jgi:hypothetical protein
VGPPLSRRTIIVVPLLGLLAAGCGTASRAAMQTPPAKAARAPLAEPATSARWGVSRVAAVQAVARAVKVANPIMRNPRYAPAESEYGVQVTCRRRSVGRYRCSWLAVNTYSLLGGKAAVQFAGTQPRVALRETSCHRHVGSGEDSAVVRCATVGYESAPNPVR